MTAEEGLSDESKGGDPLYASDREDDARHFESPNALAEERGSEHQAEHGREEEHERQAANVILLDEPVPERGRECGASQCEEQQEAHKDWRPDHGMRALEPHRHTEQRSTPEQKLPCCDDRDIVPYILAFDDDALRRGARGRHERKQKACKAVRIWSGEARIGDQADARECEHERGRLAARDRLMQKRRSQPDDHQRLGVAKYGGDTRPGAAWAQEHCTETQRRADECNRNDGPPERLRREQRPPSGCLVREERGASNQRPQSSVPERRRVGEARLDGRIAHCVYARDQNDESDSSA